MSNPLFDSIAHRLPRVALLGAHGTFSEEAAAKMFGETYELISCSTFERVFAAISEGSADYLLVPLENSLVGSVHRVHELLAQSSLTIVRELSLPVSHCLISCHGATLDSLKTIESHPMALAQCERFFAAHPHLNQIPGSDTAGSVRRIVEACDPTRAAIASRRAALIYGGVILRERLEDAPENHTRFVLLATRKIPERKL